MPAQIEVDSRDFSGQSATFDRAAGLSQALTHHVVNSELDISSPAGRPAVDLAALKRQSVRGGMVTLASQATSVLLGLTSTVVLARLLSPADYGIIAMVTAITSFAGLFRDLGLSSAAIQKHTLTHAQQSNLFWINVAFGLTLTVAVAAASPLVAWFYQEPEVKWITLALSLGFLIGSGATQSGALLVREMRFGRQAIATITGGVVTLLTAVFLAVKGFGYWALVWGQLGGMITSTCLLLILSPFRPGLPSRGSGVGEMLRFGANITAFDLANYFHRNLDNVLIGRFFGAGPLGLYSRAYSLLMFPISNLRAPINAVAFPALSRLQNEPANFRAYYLRVTSLIALLSMPLTAYLCIAAAPFVELVLGRQWLGVAPVFSYLAVAAFVQPSSGFAGSLLISLGQGRRYLKCGLFNVVVISASFVIGLPWGPVGVALSYAVANYLVLYPWLSYAYQDSPVSFRDFAGACALPAIASVVAAALALVLRPHIVDFSLFSQLVILGLVFVSVIAAVALMTEEGRRDRAAFYAMARQLRKVEG